jgi:hypothetical protein
MNTGLWSKEKGLGEYPSPYVWWWMVDPLRIFYFDYLVRERK